MIDWLNPSDDVLDARSIGFAEGQQSRDEEVAALTTERDALAAELATLRRRWNHVAGLAQTMGVKMDGQNSWRFEPLRYGRGPTIEAAVDDEIERIEKARIA